VLQRSEVTLVDAGSNAVAEVDDAELEANTNNMVRALSRKEPLVAQLTALALFACAGCGDKASVVAAGELQGNEDTSAGEGGDGQAETDVIDVAEGDFQSGEAPASAGAEALPAILSLTGPAAVTNGGTAVLHVELAAPVNDPTFVVQLDGDSGFHTVVGTDPEADGIYDISVQVAADASRATLVLRVALTDGTGNIGEYSELELELVQSGTGDVKITLSFDRMHDLDLYVIEPNGEEISYLNDASATGGQLDLDSGMHCQAGGAMSENIFWPPGGAPSGQYRVSVHNYEQCAPGATSFTVRIAHDDVVNTYTGSFADGSTGTVAEVATFER
jgi:hypothetical protein